MDGNLFVYSNTIKLLKTKCIELLEEIIFVYYCADQPPSIGIAVPVLNEEKKNILVIY
jgi:hypothetical protein